MRSWTRTVRGIWRSGFQAEALALLSAAREERAPDPLGRFGRGEGLLDVKERGEQDARDRLSIFYRMPVSWRPARRFWTKVLRSCRRSGLRNRTWPVRAFGPHTGQTRRPSPDPLPASWRPRRSTGRSDQTGVVPNTRGTPELALASRARCSRDPGRRRRSRPTLTTPRESVPRRTGRERYRTVFHGCQGLSSRKAVPSSRKLRSSYPGPFDPWSA